MRVMVCAWYREGKEKVGDERTPVLCKSGDQRPAPNHAELGKHPIYPDPDLAGQPILQGNAKMSWIPTWALDVGCWLLGVHFSFFLPITASALYICRTENNEDNLVKLEMVFPCS
jgi:hypothetical protein